MAAVLGVEPDCLLTAYQIHSPDVVTIDRPWAAAERPRADAIVTRAPGLAIGVSTADCGPVLFAEAQAGVVGVAHAGWRGALLGVIEATIGGMDADDFPPIPAVLNEGAVRIDRAALKLAINRMFNSAIVEEKSYA